MVVSVAARTSHSIRRAVDGEHIALGFGELGADHDLDQLTDDLVEAL